MAHYPSSFLGFLLVILSLCLISPNFVHSHDHPQDSHDHDHPHSSSSHNDHDHDHHSSSSHHDHGGGDDHLSHVHQIHHSPSPPTSIRELCQKHPNPNFCLKLLESKKDVTKLIPIVHFVIAESKVCATRTQATLHTLIYETHNNEELKHHYEVCLKCYGETLKNLLAASKHLDEGDIRGVNSNVIEIIKSIGECKRSIPEGVDSPIKKKSEEMIQITFVVKIFVAGQVQIGSSHHA